MPKIGTALYSQGHLFFRAMRVSWIVWCVVQCVVALAASAYASARPWTWLARMRARACPNSGIPKTRTWNILYSPAVQNATKQCDMLVRYDEAHKTAVRSFEQDSRRLLLGCAATPQTALLWPPLSGVEAPVTRSQTKTRPSSDPLMM